MAEASWRKAALIFGGGYACVMLLVSSLVQAHPVLATYAAMLVGPLLAFAALLWRVYRYRAHAYWGVLALGIGVWICALVLSLDAQYFQHKLFDAADFSDFCYFAYGGPIIFAICMVGGMEETWTFWLDVVQVLMITLLAYVLVFNVVPFAPHRHPIDAAQLLIAYNVENVLLAVAAGLRLWWEPSASRYKPFFGVLFTFLVVYAAGAGSYNHFAFADESTANNSSLRWTVLEAVPFLLLSYLAITVKVRSSDASAVRSGVAITYLRIVLPVFYTVALVLMGFSVQRSGHYITVISISVALGVYVVRNVALQFRFLRSQQQLQRANRELEKISLLDELTGVANRRHFESVLESELRRSARSQMPVALLMVDVDYFKQLNDSYGHLHGDECLRSVAQAMKRCVPRAGDIVARYGGEEFSVVLVWSNQEGSLHVAERIRKEIESLQIANRKAPAGVVTVSIGVAMNVPVANASSTDLIAAADRALYKAKAMGRNCVVFAETADSEPESATLELGMA